MIRVATVGVNDHKVHIPGPGERPRNLINRAVPTDMHSTSTPKMAALLVSVSFTNIASLPFPHRYFGECVGGEGLLALAILATVGTLWCRALRHTSRITCLSYRVLQRRVVVPPGRRAWCSGQGCSEVD